jgi:hypothetical protein
LWSLATAPTEQRQAGGERAVDSVRVYPRLQSVYCEKAHAPEPVRHRRPDTRTGGRHGRSPVVSAAAGAAAGASSSPSGSLQRAGPRWPAGVSCRRARRGWRCRGPRSPPRPSPGCRP